MSDFDIDKAAADLLAARRDRRPISVRSPGPASFDEAFRVQDAVARTLGPTGAWKVGRAPTGELTAAPIAVPLVRPSPCTWPASDLLRIGIEAEIAFRLGRQLRGGESENEIREAIAAVHAVIEVVDSRFDTWPVPDPLWALADNQNNGGLVYDPAGTAWSGQSLERAQVDITVGGGSIFSQEGANPGGDPFALLVALVAHTAGRGGLKAGDLVTTGSLNGIAFVEPGASVAVAVAGIGRVSLDLPN